MLRRVLGHVAPGVPVLLGALAIGFLLMQVAPTDPAAVRAGSSATSGAVAARKLLDEAGWAAGAHGIQTTGWNRMAEAVQADLRRVGIEMKAQLWDGTVAWGKLATREFSAFVMSCPYVSAGAALGLHLDPGNASRPNRMSWKDGETDRWLTEARAALDPEHRAEALGNVQRQVTEASVWVPLVREQPWVADSARAHDLYKGLDIRLTRWAA